MQTLTIKVDNQENALFLQELLQKFQFVKSVETKINKEFFLKSRYRNVPIQWATEKPRMQDFTSILQNRKLSLAEIREKAWKRNW